MTNTAPQPNVSGLLVTFGSSNSIDLSESQIDDGVIATAVADGYIVVNEWDSGINRGNFLILTKKGRLAVGHRIVWDRLADIISWIFDLLHARPAKLH